MADRWYKDVDKAYIQRCRALVAEVWPELFANACCNLDPEDEDFDEDDPYLGIEVVPYGNIPGYVHVDIDDGTVMDRIRYDRLEAALLALRGEGA